MSSVWLTARAVRYIGQFGVEIENAAAFGLGQRADDLRLVGGFGGGYLHRLGQLFDRFGRGAGKQEQGASQLELVAAAQHLLAHALAVDERAVGAVQIADRVAFVRAAQLCMDARDLGVVELHGVRSVATDAHHRAVQLEAPALIVAADDKK